MNRPELICLMMATVDGKILSDNWGEDAAVQHLAQTFEKIHEKIGIQAWIVGRTTMEKDFTHFAEPIIQKDAAPIDRSDFVGIKDATSFAIAVDAHAKLGWRENTMHGDHVITILTEGVADGYLAHLRQIGVSYIFAGAKEVDLELALQKLYDLFGIKQLMLEGGGHMNGSFLNEGLIDVFHLALLPMADGTAGSSTVFDIRKDAKKGGATVMQLQDMRRLEDDVLWLTYKVKK